MTWEKYEYPNNLTLTNWQLVKDAPDLLAVVHKYYPSVYLSEEDNIVEWKEAGYTYITWGGNNYSSIKNFSCLVKTSRIQWFKKESV